MRSERCRVVVKCRPTRFEEQEALGADQGISLPAPGRIVLGKEFEADHVYLPTDGDAVYEDEVVGLVGSLYEGINSTVFAYGASGSGKTHTVLGSKQNPGLVDRITDEVFGQRYDQRTCTVSVSVEELYCERFTDLLAASAHPPTTGSNNSSSGGGSHHGARSVHFRPPLQHHQHSRHAAAPVKYSWQKVTLNNSTEMKALVQHVLRKRHTASTCLNDKSSRSHVIVTITLEQRKAINEHTYTAAAAEGWDEPVCSSASSLTSAAASSSIGGSTSDLSSLRHLDSVETRSVQDDAASEAGSAAAAPVDTYLIGKLYLVDLAGSENIKRSGAEGHRQKEAGDINKSLCHLKTVIEEVFRGRRVTTYRNSKLTFRLQDALGGGNSKLLVVACISTASNDLQETKETLRFAEMARAITNSPVVNREPKDELIHRLQQQVAELQDQVKAARKEGGRAATEEVLVQLNATEAALADLKEEMEAKEAKWTSMSLQTKDHVKSLSALLDGSQQREGSLQQQLAAEQAAVQLLRQQLAAETGARQDSQQASSAATGLLLDMHQDLSTLQQHCGELQQQVEQQAALAATATRLCTGQQQQAQGMQQQLSSQAQELEALRQELQRERSARAAAEAKVAHLQQQQQQAVAAAAQQCAVEASQDMQQLSLLCSILAEQAAAAAAQRGATLQQHEAVLVSLKASSEAQAAVQQELAAAKQEACKQQQHCEDLQQHLQQQQEHHAAELSATAAASAKAAAQAARELLKQRQAFEEQLRCAHSSIAGLQKDLEDERTEHEAMLQAEQQKAAHQLAESMHSSVKKLTADKLQCREHLRMHLHDLKAETHSLSQVLASPNPAASILNSQPGSPPGSPAGSLVLAAGAAAQPDAQEAPQEGLQDDQELTPAPQQQRQSRVSPVPPLQLEPSEAVLSDTTTAAPMQDASERNLSGGETSSEGGSSSSSSASSSPGASPMSAAAQQAAMMAVAAAAAAGVAKRLTPRRSYVHVHAEAGSQGGHSDGRLSMVDSMCASEGGRDCSGDLMRLPSFGSEHAALSVSSMDGSQHGSIPATASSAAAAAVLQRSAMARVRSTPEQQRRHRKRRKELLSKSFSAFRWPISYVPEEEVDMEAAAAAFSQMRGGRLKVKNLQAFLAHRMLEQGMHDPMLLDGKRKRKHELVQDMLAYHRYHLAAVAAGGRGAGSNPDSRHSSRNGSDVPPAAEASASPAAVSPTPRSSMCSSPEHSGVWHPLAVGRPASAAPSSATSSPARLEFARYSYDSPGRGRSSSGGSSSKAAAQLLGQRTAFAVEAPDANSSRQQPDAGSPAPEQQHSPGWWSRLTPLRGSKNGGSSILGQLHPGEKPALRKSLSVQQQESSGAAEGRSPEPLAGRTSALSGREASLQQQQQRRQSGHNSRYESEGGCDAVSPRDKKHAAAASRADSGSVPSSSAPTPPPGGISLTGRAISAVTGSAVAEFYVDSPAVKLGRAGGSNKQRGSGSIDPMRLGVDLGAGSALRSSWKQAQLLRPK